MSRKKARELSMQTLFQMDLHEELNMEHLTKALEDKKQGVKKDDTYMENLLTIFVKEQETVDQAISEALKDWTLDRLPKVELAILRVATTEIIYFDDIPYKVSINEALNICKDFSDDASTNYINGALGTIKTKYEK